MDFPIIYCDPPWEYNNRAKWSDSKFGGGATGHYDVAAIGDMADWRDQFIAMRPGTEKRPEPGIMLMWCVMPQLEEAYRLMRAWGYQPIKPIWYWRKTTPNGRLFRGPGKYTMSNIEIVLLGQAHKTKKLTPIVTKGRCRDEEQSHQHPREYRADKRTGKPVLKIRHSAKPAIFRELIVEMFGDLPRVEVFAREQAEGWHAIGDQLPNGKPIMSNTVIEPLPPPGWVRTGSLCLPV